MNSRHTQIWNLRNKFSMMKINKCNWTWIEFIVPVSKKYESHFFLSRSSGHTHTCIDDDHQMRSTPSAFKSPFFRPSSSSYRWKCAGTSDNRSSIRLSSTSIHVTHTFRYHLDDLISRPFFLIFRPSIGNQLVLFSDFLFNAVNPTHTHTRSPFHAE